MENLAPPLLRCPHGAELRLFVERIEVQHGPRRTRLPCRLVGRDENLDLDVGLIAAFGLKCRMKCMTLWYLGRKKAK